MTIAGQWTVAELIDLVADKDDEMRALKSAATAFGPTWQASDPTAFQDWSADYQELRTRYLKARGDANMAIHKAKFTPVSNDIIPAQYEYVGVLRALQPVEGTDTKGSKLDLMIRLTDAGGKLKFNPPPQTATDWDLVVAQAGGKVLEQVDPALVGKPGLSPLEYGLIVGGVIFLGYKLTKK